MWMTPHTLICLICPSPVYLYGENKGTLGRHSPKMSPSFVSKGKNNSPEKLPENMTIEWNTLRVAIKYREVPRTLQYG